LVRARLNREQPRVPAAGRDQLGMGTALHDPAAVEYHDEVGAPLNRGER
jgi:hypothetical protein